MRVVIRFGSYGWFVFRWFLVVMMLFVEHKIQGDREAVNVGFLMVIV